MTLGVEQLGAVISDLRTSLPRVLVGIVGEPGSGKSTLVRALTGQLGCPSAIVPMDGFHLSNNELLRLGRADRKGAPDTFDVAGYVNLLRRLRTPQDTVVYAPDYVRSLEEPIAGAIAVTAEIPVVFTEGNYLLHSADGWDAVKPLLDQVWYLDCDPGGRIRQLIQRHQRFGKTLTEATEWATGSDERNAQLVRDSRRAADLTISFDVIAGGEVGPAEGLR